MLPHAAHARQVVLELRELDLELALGAHRVLGEDVEDQLRAVDHARVERVLEEALLRRIELVVDEQALGARLPVALLQLLELALADVRALRRAGAVLHDRADRLDARRAGELLDLGELVVGVGTLPEHREDEPALGLRGTWNHRTRLWHSPSRTLEPRRHPLRIAAREQELYGYVAVRRAARPRLRRRRVGALRQAERQAARPARRATPTPCPAQGNLPGRIEDGAVVGLGATDMKGGLAVMIELGRWAAEAELAYDLALLFFPREELGPAENPLPGVFERHRPRRRGAARGLPRADRQHAAARLPRQPQRARRLRGTLGALGAAVARRERDRRSRSRGCGPSSSSSRATSRSRAWSSAR